MKLSEHLEQIERIDQLDLSLVKEPLQLAAVGAILEVKKKLSLHREAEEKFSVSNTPFLPEIRKELEAMLSVLLEELRKEEAQQ